MNSIKHLRSICEKNISVADAMGIIDANSGGTIVVVDSGKLVGTLTDGDIRRFILNNGSLQATVLEAANRHPKYLLIKDLGSAISKLDEYQIDSIPIVNEKMEVVDIVTTQDKSAIKKAKKTLKNVPVVIMAGGQGTRLYPYTKILPKPLIPIGDTPIVERIINCFCEYQIDDFFMTVNYKKAMIESYFSELNPRYNLSFIEEPKPLGTGGSIKLINQKFELPIFVANCDSLIITDYADLYNHHCSTQNDITIVAALKSITVPYGVINSKENGEVINLQEKPKLSYFINTGMYVINPDTISKIPDNTFFHMTHLIEKIMSGGGKVGMYPISEDSFLDMGELNEMRRMEEKLGLITN